MRRDIGALDRQQQAQADARRRRGAGAAAAARARRPQLRAEQGGQRRQEAGDRPGRGRDVRRRQVDHHQRRHDDVPDGALSRVAVPAGADQLLPDRRAPALPFEEHGDRARRHRLSRPEHHPLAVRQRRLAALLGAADVHGGAGRRAAGRHRGRPAGDPGRGEADRPGRGAGDPRRFVEVPAAFEPGALRPRPGLDDRHRRRDARRGAGAGRGGRGRAVRRAGAPRTPDASDRRRRHRQDHGEAGAGRPAQSARRSTR